MESVKLFPKRGEAFGQKILGLNHQLLPECFSPAYPCIYSAFFVNHLYTAYFMLMKYGVSKQDTRLLGEVGYLEYLTHLN